MKKIYIVLVCLSAFACFFIRHGREEYIRCSSLEKVSYNENVTLSDFAYNICKSLSK